jgi:hypothetical protein
LRPYIAHDLGSGAAAPRSKIHTKYPSFQALNDFGKEKEAPSQPKQREARKPKAEITIIE